jgi:SAM-dependent methyltransferase
MSIPEDRLALGRIEVSRAASASLAKAGIDLETFLSRHRRGDWGNIEDREWQRNQWAVDHESLVFSKYTLPNQTALLISTARDRSYTYVMLGEERQQQEVNARDGYARWASYYDIEKNPLIAVEGPIVDAFLAGLPLTTALDVGAGTGRHALKLARRGVKVTAFDQSPEMMAVAQRTVREEKLPVEFCFGSIEGGLPFRPQSFDLVICALALCHVPNLIWATRQFFSLLRQGGYLVITDFHPDSVAYGWRTHVRRPEGLWFLPNVSHTRAEYVDAVEKAGLTLLDVLDTPLCKVPEGIFAFHEEMMQEIGDQNVCLSILAQRQRRKPPWLPFRMREAP